MHFTLQSTPQDEVETIISVSKKVSKSAVVRNLIRRRVRPLLKDFSLKPGRHLIIARPGADKIRGKELEEELIRLIRSIRN